MTTGEIAVRAARGKVGKKMRRVTLDPIRHAELPIDVREVESSLPAGFRVGWAEGKGGGHKFNVTSGAGCGSPWMSLTIDETDYCINVEDILRAVIKYHEEGHPKKEVKTKR